MSSTYTGDRTATESPGPLPAKNADPKATLPADGDALNAASVAQMAKEAMDYANFMTHKAGIIDQANTWSAAQSFNGASGDGNPAQSFDAVPTNRKEAARYFLLVSNTFNVYARVFQDTTDGSIRWTINASFNGTNWIPDDPALQATRTRMGLTTFYREYHAAAANWVEGGWTAVETLTGSTGALVVSGPITAGSTVAATTTVTGGTGVTATAGDVEAAAGHAKARHFLGNGSTPTRTAGAGQDHTPTTGNVTVTGNDAHGLITVITGASPDTSAIVCTITFANAYAAAPYVTLAPAEANAAGLSGGTQAFVDVTQTTTGHFVIMSGSSGLAPGVTYKWHYSVGG